MREPIARLLQLVRFSHTLFALPFALLGAVMAWSMPAWPAQAGFSMASLVGILLCMVFARTTAMAFNRLADQQLDARNPRTRTRHLPAGLLSAAAVWRFTLGSAAGFIASTLLFWPNWLPLALSIPVLLFLCAYSYTKRFTWMSHFWLGTALMLAPVCAWIAIRGLVVLAAPADLLPALNLGLAVMLWVAGFDIIYACQDYEFDRAHGLSSLPARVGIRAALRLAAACHLAMVGVLLVLPLVSHQLHWGWVYWTGVGMVGVLLACEHWLVRPNDLTRVNLAFFHVNAVVSVGLLVVACIDLLTPL